MKTSRVGNSIRNIFWGMMNRVVSIALPFIVRTIFIKNLGEEYLGLNSLYSSILQVLNLADLGFANAIVANMYKPIAEENINKVSALMNFYCKIYKCIGGLIFCGGLLLTPFIDRLINGAPPDGINIYFFWILYLLNTVVSYLFFAYKISLIKAHQRNDITEKVGIICGVITGVGQLFVVAVIKSVYLYVILSIISAILYNFINAYECNKRYPQYKCRGELDKKTKITIKKDVGALAIQKVGNTISLSLDSIVISAFLGLKTVAIYGNYYYIIQAITFFISLVHSSITASIGNSIATETKEKNYNNFKMIFFWNIWLTGWCSICFMCLFQDFMTLWMGRKLLFSINIILALILRFFFEQLRRVVHTYKDAAGIWRRDKWRPLVGCTINLILNIILVKYMSVSGVALSTVISYVFIEHPWETRALFQEYFKRSEKEYYWEMVTGIVVIFFIGLLTYIVCQLLPLYGISAIIIKLAICIILPNILFLIMNKKNRYFLFSWELIQKIISSMKNI